MSNIKLKTPDGNNDVTLSAANGGDVTVTLPTASIDLSTAGTDGQFLKTNGSGTLSFATVAASPVTALNNATANELVTVGSTTTELDAEANLTFDGNNLKVGAGAGTHVDADDLLISKDAAITGISIQNADDGYGCLNFGDASDNDIGRIAYNHNGNHMTFAANAATRMEIEDDGNVKINDGNLIIGTSGHGIDFSATSDGSGTDTSELLADYEEGEFTPIINTTSGGACSNYNYNTGRYIRIGDLCHISMFIQGASNSGLSSTTGDLWISGMPYGMSAFPDSSIHDYVQLTTDDDGIWYHHTITGEYHTDKMYIYGKTDSVWNSAMASHLLTQSTIKYRGTVRLA